MPRFKCKTRGCGFEPKPGSQYCIRCRPEDEIREEHGPKIEAAEGIDKVHAILEQEDDLVIAKSFQEARRKEKHVDEAEQAVKEIMDEADEIGPQLLAEVEQSTLQKLKSEIQVALLSHEETGIMINNVPWPIHKGMNMVPKSIAEAYNEILQLKDARTLLKKCLHIQDHEDTGPAGYKDESPKPKAYYEEVLEDDYRGEVKDRHESRSKIM